MMEEYALRQDAETFNRREEDRLQLLLRYKYMADPEEMEYWAKYWAEKETRFEKEINEPF